MLLTNHHIKEIPAKCCEGSMMTFDETVVLQCIAQCKKLTADNIRFTVGYVL